MVVAPNRVPVLEDDVVAAPKGLFPKLNAILHSPEQETPLIVDSKWLCLVRIKLGSRHNQLLSSTTQLKQQQTRLFLIVWAFTGTSISTEDLLFERFSEESTPIWLD